MALPTSVSRGRTQGSTGFGLYDCNGAFFPFEITQFQVGDIDGSQAGAQGQQQHRIIAFPQGRRTIRCKEKFLFLFGGERWKHFGDSSRTIGYGTAQAEFGVIPALYKSEK